MQKFIKNILVILYYLSKIIRKPGRKQTAPIYYILTSD